MQSRQVVVLGNDHTNTTGIVQCLGREGFDVATTVDGSVIIEINSGTGVYASQMGMEHGIADKFKQK